MYAGYETSTEPHSPNSPDGTLAFLGWVLLYQAPRPLLAFSESEFSCPSNLLMCVLYILVSMSQNSPVR